MSDSQQIEMTLEIDSNQEESYQVFYSETMNFTEENSIGSEVIEKNKTESISFEVPTNSKFLRIDLGGNPSDIKIKKLYFKYFKKKNIDIENIDVSGINMIQEIKQKNNMFEINTNGSDPYIIINIENYELGNFYQSVSTNVILLKKIALCVLFNIISIVFYFLFDKFSIVPIELYRNRKLIMKLSINDFKTKYAASYLGITWAFVNPIITVLLYWFVFQVGFRTATVGKVPFVLWLISGLIPWFFFSEALTNATSSLIEYNYLVKKLVFKISILPIVKVISSLFVHAFFLLFTIIIFMVNGYYLDAYSIQIIYYLFCMIVLILGVSYMTSAIILFFRDLGQIINIFLQIGMWMTPIMWNYEIIPSKFIWVFKLNPMYYIIEGYRDSLIDKVWFWQHFNTTIYFWIFTFICVILGTIIFRRLKVHFADVL